MNASELLGDSSPVAIAAREAARKEYLGGAKSPSQAILRVASLIRAAQWQQGTAFAIRRAGHAYHGP